MRKIAILMAAMILAGTLAFAAGQRATPSTGIGQAASATNPVTLRWVGFGFEANNTARNLIERYRTRNPHVTIEYQELGASADTDGLVRLDTLVAGGQQIDLAYLTTSDLMNRVINGAARPLTEAIRANGDDFVRDYGRLGTTATSYNGEIYGVPRAGNTFKVFYNKTMADRNGIVVPAQMTQAEFMDVAKKFQAVPNLRWPVAFNALWVQITYGAASVAGWQVVQKDNSGRVVVNYDDQRFRDTLKFFYDMAQVERLAPTVAITAAESLNRRVLFARQEVGLILDGPFTLIWLQNFMFNDPGAGRLPFEIGVSELPVLTQADKTRASYNELAGAFYAPSTNRNLLEAYKFMRFVCNENFDINGIYMPVYTGSDLNTAVSTFINFTDRNQVRHTDIYPVPTAIKAVTVPNDSFLGVFPMDPSLNKFIPPLDALLNEQLPIYLNGEMNLDNFIRELTRRGQDIVNNLR